MVMALEEGHDVTGRNRVWEDPWGCVMNSCPASPPQMCSVAEVKPLGGTRRETSPKLTSCQALPAAGRLEELYLLPKA